MNYNEEVWVVVHLVTYCISGIWTYCYWLRLLFSLCSLSSSFICSHPRAERVYIWVWPVTLIPQVSFYTCNFYDIYQKKVIFSSLTVLTWCWWSAKDKRGLHFVWNWNNQTSLTNLWYLRTGFAKTLDYFGFKYDIGPLIPDRSSALYEYYKW
jgi:hypothetical protein